MTDDREPLGRIVRETWVAWAKEQPEQKPSWLVSWDELDDGQREVDMRIGSAVAAEARRDYEAELIRLRAQVMVFTAWLPIARHALLEVAVRAGQESVAKQYRAAYQALGGGEEGAAS